MAPSWHHGTCDLHRRSPVPARGRRGGGRGEDARALAERLTAPLEAATRLVLLNALSAAAEITRELAPASVEVRLRGLDPNFVVTPTTVHEVPPEPSLTEHSATMAHDGAMGFAPSAADDGAAAGSICGFRRVSSAGITLAGYW
jgi:hypothetical protein